MHPTRSAGGQDRFLGGEVADLLFNYFESFNEGMIGRAAQMTGSMGKGEERQLEGEEEGVCEISVRLPMNNDTMETRIHLGGYVVHARYAFSEFATPSCKRGKVACRQCKSFKFSPLVWGTTCNLMPNVCLLLITRPLVHHQNK